MLHEIDGGVRVNVLDEGTGQPIVFLVLEDAGHVCNREQPEAFDRAVTEFFDAHPPRA